MSNIAFSDVASLAWVWRMRAGMHMPFGISMPAEGHQTLGLCGCDDPPSKRSEGQHCIATQRDQFPGGPTAGRVHGSDLGEYAIWLHVWHETECLLLCWLLRGDRTVIAPRASDRLGPGALV